MTPGAIVVHWENLSSTTPTVGSLSKAYFLGSLSRTFGAGFNIVGTGSLTSVAKDSLLCLVVAGI